MPLHLALEPYFLVLPTAISLLLVVYLGARSHDPKRFTVIFLLVALLAWLWGDWAAADEINAWLKLSQTGVAWIAPIWFVYLVQYASKEQRLPGWLAAAGRRQFLAWFAIFPFLLTLMIWTNEQHHLFWKAREAEIELGPVGWAGLGSGITLILAGIGLLQQLLIKSPSHKLGEVTLLLACTTAASSAYVAYTLWLFPASQANPTPYMLNVTIILFAFGLVRYRLVSTFPVVNRNLIAAMRDGILVLSVENRVVQMNPAAETILNCTLDQCRHWPVERVLAGFHELALQGSENDEEVLKEISLDVQGVSQRFELHLTTLRDAHRHPSGRLITLHNITRRYNAQEASRLSQQMLKQSEEKFRSLVEDIKEVIFTLVPDGTITYISPAVELYSGFKVSEIVGNSYKLFVYPDDLSSLASKVERVFSGQLDFVEFRILDKGQNLRYVRAYLRLVEQDGQLPVLHGILTDITDRKLIEEALERRASQLTILNYIGEQITAVIEIDSVLDSATRLIQKHFGYYHVAIFTPDYRRRALIMRSVSGNLTGTFPKNHRLEFGQGIVGWAFENKSTLLANNVLLEPRYTNLYPDQVETRAELAVPILIGDERAGVLDLQSPLENAFGDDDVRVLKTVANQIAVALQNARLYEEVRQQLKDRERKENMLRIQRDLLVRLSTAKGLDGTLKIAVETLATELHASQAIISLVDWDCRTIQPVARLDKPSAQERGPLPLNAGHVTGWVAMNERPVLVANAANDPRNLEASPGALSFLCVPLIQNERVIGVVSLESESANRFSQTDMNLMATLANSLVMLIERAQLFEEIETARTELEQRAEELEKANARLREMDRVKRQFLANMSHELRTPLNSIIGFSEVIVDELVGPLNEEQKEFVQDILESGKHLLELINDLLDFSKIEAGRLSLEPTTFEIDALFQELRTSVAPLVEKKSQVLIFQQSIALPPLTADRLRIKQVFINLLSNANKFTPDHGQITVSCEEIEPDWLLFRVQDTGIGIRPEDQELIFEEFRQIDGSLTREVSGSGLGLAITRQIIELHQGKIWVESELGRGATFFVHLPVNFLSHLS